MITNKPTPEYTCAQCLYHTLFLSIFYIYVMHLRIILGYTVEYFCFILLSAFEIKAPLYLL